MGNGGPSGGGSGGGGGGTTITSGAGDFGSGTSQTGAVLTGQVVSVQSGAAGVTPTAGDSSTKLATTAFVANVAAGINPAVAVQEATAAVLPNSPSYLNGASGIGATLIATGNAALVVDGVTVSVGDRILVKNQASPAQNGVYTVTATGSVIALYTLTRALDYDMPSDMNNTGTIPVVNGTVNAGTSWLQTSQVVTVGTDPVTFTQFSYSLASQIQMRIVTVTSAQLQNINGNPVTIIPAPGAGKLIQVFGTAYYYKFITAPYTGGDNPSLNFIDFNGDGAGSSPPSNFITAASSQFSPMGTFAGSNKDPVSNDTNQPVVLADDVNYAGGSGTLTVTITYIVTTL